MFAVPGWSLPTVAVASQKQDQNGVAIAPARKRKRDKPAEVNADNVDRLWKQVIEGQVPRDVPSTTTTNSQKQIPQDMRNPRTNDRQAPSDVKSAGDRGRATRLDKKSKRDGLAGDTRQSIRKPEQKRIPVGHGQIDVKGRGQRQREEHGATKDKAPEVKMPTGALNGGQLVGSHIQLTPLQQKMSQKLTAARFRHLNEQLYTSSSAEAQRLFSGNPSAYVSYHEGFRAQVASWPSNPVEEFISDVKERGSYRVRSQKTLAKKARKGQTEAGPGGGRLDVLPRESGCTCRIVDLGCGDARFAAALLPCGAKEKLNLNIRSFDLADNENPLITVADITNLKKAGVADSTVDVAVCCLSLMGTNWVDIVDECSRCVRPGGEVWIAEIKSRFQRPEQLQSRTKKQARPSKKKLDGDSGLTENDIMKDLDEPAKKQEDSTNLDPFLGVWQKRGFVLKNPPDRTNKMFVKLRLVKQESSHPPSAKKRFIDSPEDDLDESRVLKPCLYKTR